MNYLGQNWAAQQQVDILKDVAKNPGSGGIAAAGAGLGLGMAAGGIFGGMGQQTMQGQTIQNPSTGGNPIMEKLKQLKEMLDMGLISQADFDAKKSEILSQM